MRQNSGRTDISQAPTDCQALWPSFFCALFYLHSEWPDGHGLQPILFRHITPLPSHSYSESGGAGFSKVESWAVIAPSNQTSRLSSKTNEASNIIILVLSIGSYALPPRHEWALHVYLGGLISIPYFSNHSGEVNDVKHLKY